jgi:hypothetical protein
MLSTGVEDLLIVEDFRITLVNAMSINGSMGLGC